MKKSNKPKKKLTAETVEKIYGVFISLSTIAVVVFALFALSYIDNPTVTPVFLFFTLLSLSISRVLLSLRAKFVVHSQISFIRFFVLAGFYLILSSLLFIIDPTPLFVCIICAIYFFSIAINRVIIAIEKKSRRAYIFQGLLALAAFAVGLSALIGAASQPEIIEATVFAAVSVLVAVSMVETLGFSLSRMKLKGIVKIMRKTYAFEVLYGLVVLIITCSFYFTIMEESIPTFGDGLWYSFAVITTIGFGDFTVKAIMSRILSVLLGIYGIVVVAVITSIIVNFYNEVKDQKEEVPELNQENVESESEEEDQLTL